MIRCAALTLDVNSWFRNKQDNGAIPNFPKSKTLVICNQEDAVCNGTLDIFSAHMDYDRRVPEAACFIAKQIGGH